MKRLSTGENTFYVLTSDLLEIDSEQLIGELERRAAQPGAFAVNFCDTEFVLLRHSDAAFAHLTDCFDLLVPASRPLIWAMKRLGSRIKIPLDESSVMRGMLSRSTPNFQHYFIGGTEECNNRLRARILKQNPDIDVTGIFHGTCSPAGYLQPPELHDAIVEELRDKEPHFIWVGLGAPKKEYPLIANLKRQLRSGILLRVGFAFEVNAGMRRDAPLPRRLLGANLRHSSQFFLRVLSRDSS
jgi:N-acetylglucosaminyldiphosphoundecaprenol N-acetyl-beta-D-mannosaminyltransferase